MSRRTSKKTRTRKKQKRQKSPFRLLIVIVLLVAAVTVGIILLVKYQTFSGYRIDSMIPLSNSEENTQYYVFGNSYLKCAGDGVTYFNERGIQWNEYYSMLLPVVDISGEYAAVADMGQRNVYLYDKSGYVSRINLSHNITDVEVSDAGMVAVSSNDGNFNYIEIRDKNGNEIMTEKSVFSSRGFLMDLALSADGSRLAAVFTSIEKGTLRSRVIFYDLSGDGGSSDIIVGTFDQYESVMLTTIRFMEDDTVCAVGDTALSIYEFKDAPELVYEDLQIPWTIQSLFFQDDHIGMVTEDPEGESRYQIKVYDLTGNLQLDIGTDFAFIGADFAGSNVYLYSYTECLMYSFAGVEKLNCPFEMHIEALKSTDGRHFVYGTHSSTQFITIY